MPVPSKLNNASSSSAHAFDLRPSVSLRPHSLFPLLSSRFTSAPSPSACASVRFRSRAVSDPSVSVFPASRSDFSFRSASFPSPPSVSFRLPSPSFRFPSFPWFRFPLRSRLSLRPPLRLRLHRPLGSASVSVLCAFRSAFSQHPSSAFASAPIYFRFHFSPSVFRLRFRFDSRASPVLRLASFPTLGFLGLPFPTSVLPLPLSISRSVSLGLPLSAAVSLCLRLVRFHFVFRLPVALPPSVTRSESFPSLRSFGFFILHQKQKV